MELLLQLQACEVVKSVEARTYANFKEDLPLHFNDAFAPLTKVTSLSMELQESDDEDAELRTIKLACKFASLFPNLQKLYSECVVDFDLRNGYLQTNCTAVLRLPLIHRHACSITRSRLEPGSDDFTPSDEWAALPNVTHLEMAGDMVFDHAFQAILPHPEKITSLRCGYTVPLCTSFIGKRCTNVKEFKILRAHCAEELFDLTRCWPSLKTLVVSDVNVPVTALTLEKLEAYC